MGLRQTKYEDNIFGRGGFSYSNRASPLKIALCEICEASLVKFRMTGFSTTFAAYPYNIDTKAVITIKH
ncbi:hypothetical protein SDC9_04819 [bioreactor metagenome]|uniref:Uncharacterized protein n=1 Tax=bioreactor metagenome TaxID=1076179 RepID=A0A644T042_9ZZZZ